MSQKAPTGNGTLLPLSQNQMLLWAGQRLAPHDPLYNMVFAFEISGRIDETSFKAAFAELVRGIDVLRLVLEDVGDLPRQRFLNSIDYPLPVYDVSDEDDPNAACRAWIEIDSQHIFTPGEPLFRVALIKLADDKFTWYLNQHHLATDAWSVSIIFRRLSEQYRELTSRGHASSVELPPFCDHLLKQLDDKSAARKARAEDFWRKRIDRPAAPSSFYRRTPPNRSSRTERVAVKFGRNRSDKLKTLATSSNFAALTPDLARFQLFATILCAYLFRVGGNERISVGVPSHGRPDTTSKRTAGLFIEIFPLIIDVSSSDSFTSLYRKIGTGAQELLLNSEPGASSPECGRAFDVVLNFVTATFGDFAQIPTKADWIHAGYGDRNHLLRMQVHDFDQDGELDVFIDLNVDTFVGAEKERAAEHIRRIADGLLADPETAIGEVPLVEGDARTWLVETLNATPDELSIDESVIDRVAARANASPDDVALVDGEHTLSYSELLARVDSLAATLQARGAAPGQRIAVALPRSIDAVVSILATMRLGAAFVPVDITYPTERMRWILADTGSRLVLTHAALRQQLPKVDADVLEVDKLSAENTRPSPAFSPPAIDVASPAYVLYTSGSTGKPNGVVINHRGLANYIGWCRKFYFSGQALDMPLFSSLSFDLTITSLLLPLVSGGRLVIYGEDAEEQDYAIRRVIEDNAVDAIKLTPAHLSLIHAMDFSASRLKKIIVGGEDFKTELAALISRYFDGQVEIYNEYGPTEGTVACMIHRFDPEQDTGASVPIGRSIDNAQIYLLDQYLSPVPQGVPGEIFIGGVGVADGYLNQPQRTKDRFLPDPFRPGARMYKTGDLARYNADGVAEFLGRNDHQVKIKGVRIETAEIEAALLEHPAITECTVDAIVRTSAEASPAERNFCLQCGLDGAHPSARLSAEGICRTCLIYREERAAAEGYFRSMDELREMVPAIKKSARGEHDCLMLLSGGKDSTFALAQLVDLGLNPLVFTLDNGFISDGAKANIRHIVDHLGLELVTGTTPAMNEIFADSLKRYSNVCEGCFKTIYTLSTKLAVERGISCIVTGLSRGQIFETRVADLFSQRVFDPDRIDHTIVEARKAYHRMDDAVSRNIDCSLFESDDVFHNVQYLDFYRYCDVRLDDVLEYLKERVAWVRPADTGRSTNCLINDVGIYVHKKERGYHNYAAPYSWDVRLGHKDRDAARDELNDRINIENVERILDEVGYEPDEPPGQPELKHLVAWYTANRKIPEAELAAQLSLTLPAEYLPRQFVRLPSMPLTHNGKVDRSALPDPGLSRPDSAGEFEPANGPVELQLAALWSDVLGVDRIGANDNFFELGGDSILNIQIVARAKQQGLAITPQDIFEYPTIRALAAVAGSGTTGHAEQSVVTGPVPLTPIQHRFFEKAGWQRPGNVSQVVVLSAAERLDARCLTDAWRMLLNRHDALRARYDYVDDAWQQVFDAPGETEPAIEVRDFSALSREALDSAIDDLARTLSDRLDPTAQDLSKIALVDCGPERPQVIVAVIHHLVVDAVSWWILLQDLDTAYGVVNTGQTRDFPAKTSSMRQWVDALSRFAGSNRARKALSYWDHDIEVLALPVDHPKGRNGRDSARTVAIELDRGETTALLQALPSNFRVQVPEVLLAAIRRAVPTAPGQALRIDVEGHGREAIEPEVDLLRTVGWFTSIYPVDLPDCTDDTARDTLAAVKNALRSVPLRGAAYGALRYLHPEAVVRRRLSRRRPADLLFNYLGQWNTDISASRRFAFARPLAALHDAEAPRDHVLEINAQIFDGVLRLEITYSSNLHDQQTVDELAGAIHSELRDLLSLANEDSAAIITPADFPAAGLDKDELDSLLEEFGQAD